MDIANSTLQDLETIFELYGIASAYQKAKKTVVVWPEFDRDMVVNEINENRQWKLLIEGEVACVWATTFSDEKIWEEKNKDAAVYIHRIATNPKYRGHNFIRSIVEWAKNYAKLHDKKFARLDTLGDNQKLIAHYTNAGFDFLGMHDLKDTSGLPDHYHGVPVCLFELEVK